MEATKSLKAQDESHQRNMQLIERTASTLQTQEAMLKRQQADFNRFKRIPDTWKNNKFNTLRPTWPPSAEIPLMRCIHVDAAEFDY